MPAFLYKVKDDTGRTLFGLTEVPDVKDIKKQFRNSEFYFVSAARYDLVHLSKIALSLDDLLMFTHRFSSLIEAGVPILSSLHILWKQSETKNVQIIVSHIRRKLEEGATLREAFGDFPRVFSGMYLALIAVAEVGAGLVEILKKISEYLQDQRQFISRVKRATLYPAFVLGFALLVMVGMFAFVVPTFQKVILRLHGELPFLTKFLLGISNVIRNPFFIAFAVVAVVAGIIFYHGFSKTKTFRFMVDSWKLKAPFLKDVLYPLSVGRFVRSLGLLIGSGVPLVVAIDVAKTTVVNVRIEAAIDEIRKQVVEGGTLYEAFKSTKTFPIMLVEMVGIGESSGKLQQLMERLADHFDEEADYALHKFLTFLEPLLIILVGGIVLVVLLGIYLPIFSLQSVLRTL